MKRLLLLLTLIALYRNAAAQTGTKILFDARKAEMAGNADWVIDADLYNIGTGTGGVMQSGAGSEANPQRFPTPSQSGISSTTGETYWKGALSSWAIAMVKRGYTVETLPNNGLITYGNSSNVQDLTNYAVIVCVEPNIRFTATEKTAILQFVQNGGGLFMGGNHSGSDRNSDGWDAPAIWNDLMSSNGSITNPFGITFDPVNFSQTTSNVAPLTNNSILKGAAGSVTQMKYSSGTSMTLNKTINPTALGLVFKTGASATGSVNVMFAQARYGSGRVAAIGDSSPIDDGTGDTGDQLYNGWSAEVNGNHARIITNATLWLAGAAPRFGAAVSPTEIIAWPNPATEMVHLRFPSHENTTATIRVCDITGRIMDEMRIQEQETETLLDLPVAYYPSGAYFISITGADLRANVRIIKP